MHFFSTLMVSLDSIFSSIWIVVANSWQQTPAGHHVVPVLRDGVPLVRDGVPVFRAEIVDFWAMVFSPSSVHRLVYVWIGAFLVGAFFVMSIAAWSLSKGLHREFARRSFDGGLALATVSALAMLVSGHGQAGSVYRHQPAKLAAFEGHYRTGPADLNLFGAPDDEARTVRRGVAVPGGLGLLLQGDASAKVVGLTLLAVFFRWRGTPYDTRWLLWLFVPAVVLPIVGNELGWVAAEVGRQPERERGPGPGLSRRLRADLPRALALGAVWVFVLDRKIRHGPDVVRRGARLRRRRCRSKLSA